MNNKYKIIFEKNDQWSELGVFDASSENEALTVARESEKLLNHFTEEEVQFVNLEVEE